MMTRLFIALTALVIIGGLPAAQSDSSQSEIGSREVRVYDITNLLRRDHSHHFAPFALEGLPRDDFDAPLTAPTWGSESGFPKGATFIDSGYEVTGIEEYTLTIAGACENAQDVELWTYSDHSRTFFRVAASRATHKHIDYFFERTAVFRKARVHMTVHRNKRLLGTAMGRPGDDMKVASFERSAVAHDSVRMNKYNDSAIKLVDPVAAGHEVVAWAVPLPDGSLRMQGQITRHELEEVRPVETQNGILEMPTIAVYTQPFAAEVADPGDFTVTTAGGDEYQFTVSCGADLSGFQRTMPDGTTMVGLNAYGLLRGNYDDLDLLERNSGHYLAMQVFNGIGYSYTSSLADGLDRSLESAAIDQVHGMGGFIQVDFKPSTHDTPTPAEIVERLNDWVSASVANFRLQVWHVDEAATYNSESLGNPVEEFNFSVVDDQTVVLQRARVRWYVSQYIIPILAQPAREVWDQFVGGGNSIRLQLKDGRVEALYKHQDILEISATDLGIRDPGPLIIESPTTRRHTLEFAGTFTGRESITAVTPAWDGKVLVGKLERVD